MRKYLVALLFGLCAASYAIANSPVSKDYKPSTARADYHHYTVAVPENADAVRFFLKNKLATLQSSSTDILLSYKQLSPTGYHYTYQQTYKGVPIFSSEIALSINKNGETYSLYDDSYEMMGWNIAVVDFDYQSLPIYRQYVTSHFGDVVMTITAKKMIAMDYSTATPLLCYQVAFKNRNGTSRTILISRNKLLRDHDDAMYHHANEPDSIVTGMVFNPDPLTTAHTFYTPTGPYQDFNDSDVVQLNAQRQLKSFTASYDTGNKVFSLSNQYVSIQDINGDGTIPVFSMTPTFNYTRHQSGFEDVMTYYHINQQRSHIHNLGFTVLDTLVVADSHGTMADNSYFANPSSLYLGTGGVDDAEDADVIVHEYTHFLSWNANQSNGSNATLERQAIDEGTCDYMAASYSKVLDTFDCGDIYNWDGHNQYWKGRSVVLPLIYPTDNTGNIYKRGSLWSAALMEIWDVIGRNTTDSLVVETLYGLPGNITMLDAANKLISTEQQLFNGKYHCPVTNALANHGLAPSTSCKNGVEEIPTLNTTLYPDKMHITNNDTSSDLVVNIYNLTGQRLGHYLNQNWIMPEFLPLGIYIVTIKNGDATRTIKWAKRVD